MRMNPIKVIKQWFCRHNYDVNYKETWFNNKNDLLFFTVFKCNKCAQIKEMENPYGKFINYKRKDINALQT